MASPVSSSSMAYTAAAALSAMKSMPSGPKAIGPIVLRAKRPRADPSRRPATARSLAAKAPSWIRSGMRQAEDTLVSAAGGWLRDAAKPTLNQQLWGLSVIEAAHRCRRSQSDGPQHGRPDAEERERTN